LLQKSSLFVGKRFFLIEQEEVHSVYVEKKKNLSMQMGGNDGTCLLKGSLAMYMVHDPGIKPLND
jgi:hypothetical protein